VNREREPAFEEAHEAPGPALDGVEPAGLERLAGVPAGAGAELLRRKAVMRMQQGQGNAWVARQVAAGLLRQGDPAREAFVARGVMPSPAGLDFQSATGLGGFNVKYDPTDQRLTLALRVGIEYKNALAMIPFTGIVMPLTPDFAADAAAVTANFPDVTARTAEVTTNWQWNAGEDTQWGQDYATQAAGVWGGQHHFVSDRWDDLFADVVVSMDVHTGHRATDHCKATVFKVPAGSTSGPGAVVNSGATATSATGTFTSSALGATSDFLNYSLQFPSGSASLQQAVSTSQQAAGDRGDQHLDKLIVDFQRGTPTGGAAITVTGHSSATGSPDANMTLSRRRADAVANYLRTRGQQIASTRITVEAVGDQGATADPSFQRVDIRVGDGRPQVTMAHETGHMFGLDDEYASPPGGIAPGAGTPGTIGTRTAHGNLPAMGGGVQPAVFENNDNIMSVGNVVRPQHYVTFLEALNAVTTPERFHYGGEGHSPTVIPDLIGPQVTQPDDPTAVV
jgi:outer membrane protein OmpA-like peptidoglycan-associated protein